MHSVVSVGIDIGTTTTQVVFSRLFFDNTAGLFFAPEIAIVRKQRIYCGNPHLTPLINEREIDADQVRAIVEEEYKRAGQSAESVATGAVIITGETAKKRNSAALLKALSPLAGEFVAEAAGPDWEAVIAGRGSGAAAYSKNNRCRVLNIDIGGGTSNAALFDNGESVSTGCIEVGGRHITTDGSGRITGMTQAAKLLCESRRITLCPGERNADRLRLFVGAQTDLLEMFAGLLPRDDLFFKLVTPGSANLDVSGGYDAICLSGGVSDAVFGAFADEDDFRFGDVGILLGRQIASSELVRAFPLVHSQETIRATVTGAGAHTLLVSGSTIDAAEDSLPQRNLPVLFLPESAVARLIDGEPAELANQLKVFLEQREEDNAALAFAGDKDPSYTAIRKLASSLSLAAEQVINKELPLIVVVEQDMAKALGQALRQQTKRPVIAIDRVKANRNDRIDIGKHMMNGSVVPVVVKTLIFGAQE